MKKTAREFLLAVQVFSRIPVAGSLAGWAGDGPLLVRACVAHFPGVGLLVGMAACVAFAVIGLLLPEAPLAPLASAIGCTVATVLLTGAFHEEALARLAARLGAPDGGAATTPATIALVLALGMKAALLGVIAAQSPAGVLATLLAAHAVSRFWPLVVARTLPHTAQAEIERDKPLTEPLEMRSLLIAAAWCVPALLLMALVGRVFFMLAAMAVSAAAFWGMRALLRRRLRGFDGNALGATQQVCEVAFYLGAAIGIGGGR